MAEADKDMLNDLIERCKTDNQKVKDLLQNIAEKELLIIPEEEPEFDESIANDVKTIICPECGHEFPI
jgi:hypothetical protein